MGRRRRLTLDEAIASLEIEPTFTSREAAAFFPRSFQWMEWMFRKRKFVRPDGTLLRVRRLENGYRRFSLTDIRDMAVCARNQGKLSFEELSLVVSRLLDAAEKETGKLKI